MTQLSLATRILKTITNSLVYTHRTRQTRYIKLGTGLLQTSKPLADDTILVLYADLDTGEYYFRTPAEFEDGRFTTKPGLVDLPPPTITN